MFPCPVIDCQGMTRINAKSHCPYHPRGSHTAGDCLSIANITAPFNAKSSKASAVTIGSNNTDCPPDGYFLLDSCSPENILDTNQSKVYADLNSAVVDNIIVAGVVGQVECKIRMKLKGTTLTAIILPEGRHLDYPILSEDALRQLGWEREKLPTGRALTHPSQAPVYLHIFNKNLFVNYRHVFPRA